MALRRQRAVELKIRLYPGQDDALVRWLEQFRGLPYGVKSQAVREALLRGIGENGQGLSPAPAVAVDLAEIRQVVEAAIATALARCEGQLGGVVAQAEEDDETEALLDGLGAALVLRE